MARYDWPGNVRELEHAIHRAAVLARAEQGSQAPVLDISHFNLTPAQGEMMTPPAPAPLPAQGVGLRAATDAFQLRLIRQTLERFNGNWAATARQLEMDGGNLHRLAKRLGLK